ncbi:hypothetical protein J1N35_023695 [Gossypium stocksii]|uniref:Uncharacterized protein n=1 Tax=Gossypium stocksii TaxID=47602 RepID=A0A9D4A4M6_9ROSI|nr:hypothetical protein J1N35_023695 [Gossypium stocksii]
MLKKCPKKSVLSEKDKLEGKAKRLGSSARVLKPRRPKGNGSDKAPTKLGLSEGKVKSNRAKRGKKKRVKCFLYCGSHELQNCPEQSKLAMVKRKATTELVESSEGLPPKEKVSYASDLEEEVAKQTWKLRPMMLNSGKVTELVELLTKLPSKEKGPFKILKQGGQGFIGMSNLVMRIKRIPIEASQNVGK